mmetsp:Transcript_14667/g.16306  ORF Transcript_14667/g.16306 Transcript_14667/m.16306 type:complete len:102 (-) Transcript_14667:131-436(-)
MARLGGNLVLASALALLSYVPFEWVAKGSLLVCAILFILDPIPPVTRLLSLISLFVVMGLTKLYNRCQQELKEQQELEVIIVEEEEDKNSKTTDGDKTKES